MQAQVLEHPGQPPTEALSARTRPDPEPGPGQVLIAVSASAVCRTDLQLVAGDLPAHQLPVIPSHQVVGKITAVGDGVAPERRGQRVGLVWLARSCQECRFCKTGRENLCRNAQFTGWDIDGGYADKVVADAAFAHPIPDLGTNFPSGPAGDAAIAPLLCGGVIGFRSLRVAGLGPESASSSLGLFGFGASAQLALQIARFWDIRTFVITRSEREAQRAIELGAEWSGTYTDTVPVSLDAAITFAPVGWVVNTALQSLDRGGTVAINAIHLDDIPSLDYDDLWWERSIRSVANVTRQDVTEFLNVVGPANVKTQAEILPLSAVPTALDRLNDGDVSGAFVLQPD